MADFIIRLILSIGSSYQLANFIDFPNIRMHFNSHSHMFIVIWYSLDKTDVPLINAYYSKTV
jgi:hypothetical protein